MLQAANETLKSLSNLGFDGVMFVSARVPRERMEQKKQGYSRGLRTSDLATIDAGRELLQAVAVAVGHGQRPVAADEHRARVHELAGVDAAAPVRRQHVAVRREAAMLQSAVMTEWRGDRLTCFPVPQARAKIE